jgi:hypothetical protein
MLRMPTDDEWTQNRVEPLPPRWQSRLLKRWHKSQAKDYFGANVELRVATATLLSQALPLDASDASICDAASSHADRCSSRAEIFHTAPALRAAMERICDGQDIKPPPAKTKDQCAIARMCCPLWWRRKLRSLHGRKVEAAAIQLGLVNRFQDLYVSNEGLRARTQQNARNKAALESTLARNELGQEFTLAELASKSTANKPIRRAELMTRIAGFERWANGAKHEGLFFTITCPSRFHPFRTVNKGKAVAPNPKYDPNETPGTAQKYLAQVWRCTRSDLKRRGLGVYGIRIAEPQHDATPHWHFLLFCKPEDADGIEGIVAKHALKDSPDEPGARQHRCDFKRIDPTKGSATGYVVKYVSKNIDGHNVGDDLEGRPALETAKRVEAWAALWGIRQFQQIGGPPVSVWRELRRVAKMPTHAPECLKQAHAAANKTSPSNESEGAAAAWDKYCEAQGGVFCGRKALIKLLMEQPEKLGRYGEQQAMRPAGVWAHADDCQGSPHRCEIHSTRFAWEIVRGQRKEPVQPLGAALSEAQPLTPWTSVNNCTSPNSYPEPSQSHQLPSTCKNETSTSSYLIRHQAPLAHALSR